jgi:uncharacterized protein (DUF1697 family)
MPKYIALLRGINLGGNNKVPMSELKSMCDTSGFQNARTYINSGNVVFDSKLSEFRVKTSLEKCIAAFAGKPIVVVVRTGPEMAAVLAANPFKKAHPGLNLVIFLDAPPPKDTLKHITGKKSEEVALGAREIYVHYKEGVGTSKLKIPAAAQGTARNMNTVAKLADWAAG